MKFKKIDKITQSQLNQYNKQNYTSRKKDSNGGYEYIVFGTDQDLD